MSLHLSCEPLLLSPALLAEGDILDADLGEFLPMALLFRVVLTALLLEHDDLVVESVLDDLARHVCALQARRANVGLVAVGAEDDVVERDLGAGVAGQGRDSDCLAGLGAELLAAGPDYGVSHTDSFGYQGMPAACYAIAYCCVTSRPCALTTSLNSSGLSNGSSRNSREKFAAF